MKARATLLTLALTFVGASTAGAASITINANNGTLYSTNGLTDFSTVTSQMNGMEVTAYWTVGGVAQGPQTVAWNSGAFFTGTDFDLTVSGDTFTTNGWQLDFSISGAGLLQKLVFNGVPGNTVFDRTNPNTGTPGSDQGKDFAGFDQYCTGGLFSGCLNGTGFLAPLVQGNIVATYSNAVRIGNGAPVGDLYAAFQMEFLSFGGLAEGTNWQFSLDTDIATTKLLDPVQLAAVPEPGSMVLLGTGLLALAAAARRRARRS